MANRDIDAKIGSVVAAPLFETIASEAICPKLSNIGDMAINGSGVRDPARVLKINPTTVIEELKKAHLRKAVNEARLVQMDTQNAVVQLFGIEDPEVELDEMWSFVQSKSQQRWLWHAIDHETREVLAYVLAPDHDEAFLKLKALLAPFGIQHFYSDGWGAYERHLDPDIHTVGKREYSTY